MTASDRRPQADPGLVRVRRGLVPVRGRLVRVDLGNPDRKNPTFPTDGPSGPSGPGISGKIAVGSSFPEPGRGCGHSVSLFPAVILISTGTTRTTRTGLWKQGIFLVRVKPGHQDRLAVTHRPAASFVKGVMPGALVDPANVTIRDEVLP